MKEENRGENQASSSNFYQWTKFALYHLQSLSSGQLSELPITIKHAM